MVFAWEILLVGLGEEVEVLVVPFAFVVVEELVRC